MTKALYSIFSHLNGQDLSTQDNYSKLRKKFFKLGNFDYKKSYEPTKECNLFGLNVSEYFSNKRLSDAYHSNNKTSKIPEVFAKKKNSNEISKRKQRKKSVLTSK